MVKNRVPGYSFLSFRMGGVVGSKELWLKGGFPVFWIPCALGRNAVHTLHVSFLRCGYCGGCRSGGSCTGCCMAGLGITKA